MADRYLRPFVIRDLERKMVFLAGPRQVGKTTLARSIPGAKKGYLLWDDAEHRESILRKRLPESALWVFDELHKYRSWRSYLKGLYDLRTSKRKILVTGSARLDYYRHGGDSLQGRYHFWRMHPVSVAELKANQSDLMDLLKLGGFPEPLFSGSDVESRRWSREYRTRLIQEDLLGVETVKDLGNLELLMLSLPERVGSPLSVNGLREELQVHHRTVEHWLEIFERLYAIFRLTPFGAPRLRAVKKERKHYHFDWTLVREDGKRFENLVACHLLKWVHFEQDNAGRDLELKYFRDVDRREIDFVVVEDGKPIRAVECNWSEAELNPALTYFKERFPTCDAVQIHVKAAKTYLSPMGVRSMPALDFLRDLV